MKATIGAVELRAALGKMALVIEKRNTIPVLGKVLFEFNGKFDELTLTATDLDIEIAVDLDCTVDGDGSVGVVLPIKELVAFLTGSSGPVAVEINEAGDVTFKADHCELEIVPHCQPEDWPVMTPSTDRTSLAHIPQSYLLEAFRHVAVAISTEETRYYLNGVYMHEVEGNLCMVATDGHRLAKLETDQVWPLGDMIWPRKTVSVLRQLLKVGGNDPARISSNMETQIFIEVGSYRVRSKVIDGTFPDYTRVIPGHKGRPVQLGAVVTKAAIGKLLATERSGAVRLDLDKGVASLKAHDSQTCATVPIQTRSGVSTIGFSLKYLKAFLAIDDELLISSAAAGDPAILTGKRKDLTWVLMPMRV